MEQVKLSVLMRSRIFWTYVLVNLAITNTNELEKNKIRKILEGRKSHNDAYDCMYFNDVLLERKYD